VRAWIYDRLIVSTTASWARTWLESLPNGSRALEIGIGTGAAMATAGELLDSKDLQLVGVDIDTAYLKQAEKNLSQWSERVTLHNEGILEHGDGPYDAICFSACFMLLPDQQAALVKAQELLKPGGIVGFTLTYEHKRSAWMERFKPMLRVLTTIDFGQVTYKDDFYAELDRGGVEITEDRTLQQLGPRSTHIVWGRFR